MGALSRKHKSPPGPLVGLLARHPRLNLCNFGFQCKGKGVIAGSCQLQFNFGFLENPLRTRHFALIGKRFRLSYGLSRSETGPLLHHFQI
jgi:hypothetical protein